MQNTAKQNYPGSVAYYDIQQGKEIGLFYNALEPTQGSSCLVNSNYSTVDGTRLINVNKMKHVKTQQRPNTVKKLFVIQCQYSY